MTAQFCYTRIDTGSRSWQEAWPRLQESVVAPLAERGATLWGAFYGLFGIAASDVVLVTHAAGGDARPVVSDPAFTVRKWYALTPTVRPTMPAPPLTRAGLYVFRFFEVDPANVEEVVRLSNEAWTTFENTPDYRAEPQGLFRPAPGAAPAHRRMLLLTWYDGFGSWERSRRPAPAARENFLRRQQLTGGTVAYATRLVGVE